jgi:alpha,alpha-trehalose-phosphate synthase [UDP-forming]/trehalose-phosphatase
MELPLPAQSDDRLVFELARDVGLTLLLDLDGTLIPFAATTEAATLDPDAVAILDTLRAAGVRIVVVSGRPRHLLDPMRGVLDGAWWVAEHGSWSCLDGHWIGPAPAPEVDDLTRLFAPFISTVGVHLESKSESLCVHWRLVPFELKEDLIAGCSLACDEWLESHPDFERLDGVETLEVRRRASNKGRAVAIVRERLPGTRIIAIGDDRTDEDMFAALRDDELAIGVGASRTRVRGRLRDHVAVRSFLVWLHQARTGVVSTPFPALESRPASRPTTRLLVVSNRIPPISEGRQRPVGGLVAALEPALRSSDGIWLGWSGGESDADRRITIIDDAPPGRASFEFRPGWREHYYDGFCNRALWPLFHGFPGRVRYSDADWLAYVAANAEFARHAFDLVAPDGVVWMHDYHLLLASRSLRSRGFDGPIGLFLHVPFPHADLFDTLPWADEILTGMLDFDMIGFHTEQWAENFRACVRARGREESTPEIGVLPIGIDPLAFVGTTGPRDRDVAALCESLGARKLILGVDRLDYSKGIPERLIAFERLLERSPEWRRRVSFVQVSVPSRAEVPEYAELRQSVEKLVGKINGRFGEADWVPVRYLYRSYDQSVLTELYRLADVGLVTPLRDGLNLVAKEFVASQDRENPGVLVLSRFAGAAAELCDAVLTNPFHPDGLACDIDRALRMEPEERKRRHDLLAAAIANKTPQRWAAAFLDRLESTRIAC